MVAAFFASRQNGNVLLPQRHTDCSINDNNWSKLLRFEAYTILERNTGESNNVVGLRPAGIVR